MRSERDAINGLKKYILEWGVTDEANLKVGHTPLIGLHLDAYYLTQNLHILTRHVHR